MGSLAARKWSRTAGLLLATTALALTTGRADTYSFGVMAGNGVTLDHTDGTGTNARLFNPTSVAIDAGGTLYVADGGDHTVRKITAGGAVSTLAGVSGQAGTTDGTGSGARFQYPYAVAVDAGGNVYVTDIGSHTVRKITAAGSVSTIAGVTGVAGSVDGIGTAAQFSSPQGIAVDAAGSVYVADTNNSTIRRIAPNGTVTTFAGAAAQTGTADDTGGGARFSYPAGLAVDTVGNVYVADFGNSSIRKISSGGNVTTLAGFSGVTGTVDGSGLSARFDHPSAVAVDAAGNVYAIDTSNQTVRRITTGGSVTTLAGSAGIGGKADGLGAAARFFYPAGVAVNNAGTTIYVVDTGNHSIRTVTAAGAVSTLAGATGLIGIADGALGTALFAYPYGLAVDAAGTVYVADHNNHTIRRVTAGGTVTTLAGSAGLAGSADGVGAAARFNGPTGVAVDSAGNVYVTDADNSTIRKITGAGTVSTFAGAAGQTGGNDGIGADARFNKPQGLAVDSAGNVYVADTNNNTVRKITATGSVSTLAGAAEQTGSLDGLGASARFNGPYAVAVDGGGSVYVADFSNFTVRKITAGGSVSTLAGFAGLPGTADGPAGAARFNQSYGIAVDGAGNVFVADAYNRAIRKISGGVVTTLNGQLSRFYYPQGIAVDRSGNLYIADGDNQTITKATFVLSPTTGTARLSNLSVRTQVGTDANIVIVGLAIGGTGAKQMIVRGVGPALTQFGVAGALAAPQLSLFSSNNVVLSSNSGWSTAPNAAAMSVAFSAVGAFALPAGSADSAIYQPLTGGTYTAQIAGANNSTGIGLAEFYDTDTGTPTARLTNASARAQVGTGSGVLIAGFAILGTGTETVLIRGIGPALTQFGVAGALSAPQITVFDSTNTPIATNAGWDGSATLTAAFAKVSAFNLAPGAADCALVMTLSAGTYTVQLSGANSTTGVGLVEVYELP